MGDVDPLLLAHAPDTDHRGWRESIYFNLGSAESGIGVWVYAWTFPNQDKTHTQVVLYRGIWPKPILTRKLASATGPVVLERGDDWLYAFHHAGPATHGEDFDAYRFGGLSIDTTRDPAGGHRYRLAFDDGSDTRFTAELHTFEPLWLYSAAPAGCPPWLASDRYHQAAGGRLEGVVRGRQFVVEGQGETDHSWGRRDHRKMAAVEWDYWAWCSTDGAEQLSLFRFVDGEESTLLGHLTIGGVSEEVTRVDGEIAHGDDDVSQGGLLVFHDASGRSVSAQFSPSYSAVGYGNPEQKWSEGYEAVCAVVVDGVARDGLHAHTRPHR